MSSCPSRGCKQTSYSNVLNYPAKLSRRLNTVNARKKYRKVFFQVALFTLVTLMSTPDKIKPIFSVKLSDKFCRRAEQNKL